MSISVSKIWIDIPQTNKTNVVANIAARNGVAGMLPGDQVYVSDASGDPLAATNKYATYIWSGAVWLLLNTQNSAVSDQGSQTITISANTASSGTIYTVQNNTRIDKIEVEIPAGLTGAPTLTIGDAAIANRLLDTADVDFLNAGDNISEANYLYATSTPILWAYSPDTNTTAAGNISITVFYFGS